MRAFLKSGRGEWIRTTDPSVPNRVLYQAEPRPDKSVNGYSTLSSRGVRNILQPLGMRHRIVGREVRLQRRDRQIAVLHRLEVRAVVRLPVVLPFFDPVVRLPSRIGSLRDHGDVIPLALD